MTRSNRMHGLASRLAKTTQIAIDATYESSGRLWFLDWEDGPTVDTMTRLATKAARGYLPSAQIQQVRFRRSETVLATCAAFAQHLISGEHEPEAWEAGGIVRNTDFPDGISDEALLVARYVVAKVEAQPNSNISSDAERPIKYLADARRNGVATDMWLDPSDWEGKCQISPPTLDTSVLAGLNGEVRALYEKMQQELVGTSVYRKDPRARMLAAQEIRTTMTELVDECQRADAAEAVVEGHDLATLSREIGLEVHSLSEQLVSLDKETRVLIWARDHVSEWLEACHAASRGLERSGGYLSREHRHAVYSLANVSAADGWKAVAKTAEAARLLVRDSRIWGQTTQSHRDRLAGLLDALDGFEQAT